MTFCICYTSKAFFLDRAPFVFPSFFLFFPSSLFPPPAESNADRSEHRRPGPDQIKLPRPAPLQVLRGLGVHVSAPFDERARRLRQGFLGLGRGLEPRRAERRAVERQGAASCAAQGGGACCCRSLWSSSAEAGEGEKTRRGEPWRGRRRRGQQQRPRRSRSRGDRVTRASSASTPLPPSLESPFLFFFRWNLLVLFFFPGETLMTTLYSRALARD